MNSNPNSALSQVCRVHTTCAACSVTRTQSRQRPTLVATPLGRLCRDKETSIVTGVLEKSVAPICAHCHDTKTMSRHKPTQQLISPVATPRSLSRHRLSHLFRDKGSSFVTGLPKHAYSRARRPSVMHARVPAMHVVAPTVTTPLQCRDPKQEMGSSPPCSLPYTFSFLFYIL